VLGRSTMRGVTDYDETSASSCDCLGRRDLIPAEATLPRNGLRLRSRCSKFSCLEPTADLLLTMQAHFVRWRRVGSDYRRSEEYRRLSASRSVYRRLGLLSLGLSLAPPTLSACLPSAMTCHRLTRRSTADRATYQATQGLHAIWRNVLLWPTIRTVPSSNARIPSLCVRIYPRSCRH
jgi:hypothetical protein